MLHQSSPLRRVLVLLLLLAPSRALAQVPGRTEMPDVRRHTLEQAQVKLGAAQLRVEIEWVDARRGQAEGLVVRQWPNPRDWIWPGDRVTLRVTREPLRTVPDVRGMTHAQAADALRGAGLGGARADSAFAAGGDAGRVVAQDPAPGARVARGTAARITLARAGRRVPELNGRTLAEARALLDAAGLALGAQDEIDSDRARPGTVLGQAPAPGVTVAPGSAVTVALARRRMAT
ncbi:MAG TPA: PASTA domain-containing protein, partial [Longimicrobium sp.]|nr:PASTA domain-containing protein [Longimicrobium sp.]